VKRDDASFRWSDDGNPLKRANTQRITGLTKRANGECVYRPCRFAVNGTRPLEQGTGMVAENGANDVRQLCDGTKFLHIPVLSFRLRASREMTANGAQPTQLQSIAKVRNSVIGFLEPMANRVRSKEVPADQTTRVATSLALSSRSIVFGMISRAFLGIGTYHVQRLARTYSHQPQCQTSGNLYAFRAG